MAGAIAGAIAAPIVGGVVGNILSQGDKDRQLAIIQAMRDKMAGVSTPAQEDLLVNLERFEEGPKLTNEQQQLFLQGDTAYKDIAVDPRLKEAQMTALERMRGVSETGMSPIERAQMADVSRQTERDAQARSQAIMMNRAQRGISGGGDELAAQLAGSAAASERQASNSQQQAANAYARSLEAMRGYGSMAGQMNEQEFGQQAQKARAEDVINAQRAQNRQSVEAWNVAARNEAARSNVDRSRNVLDRNVLTQHEQEMYNKKIPMQLAEFELSKAKGEAGAMGAEADYYGQQAAGTKNMWSQGGQGVAQGIGQYSAYQQGERLAGQNAAQAAQTAAQKDAETKAYKDRTNRMYPQKV